MLLFAIRNGHEKEVFDLIEAGANVKNCRENSFDMKSPLHIAAEEGHVNVVQRLLNEKRFQVDIRCMHEKSPMYLACLEGHVEVVKVLLQHAADVSQTDEFKGTPLHVASESGFLDIVKVLLLHNARVDTTDKLSRMPIHYAAQYGYGEVVMELLKHNSPINEIDVFRQTPLHVATENGHIAVVRALFESKIELDINAVDRYGCAALTNAVIVQDIDLIKLLLSNNADIDILGEEKQTSLHVALLRTRNDTIAQLLIEHGADFDKMDEFGQSPITIIGALNNKDLITYCANHKNISREKFEKYILPSGWTASVMEDVRLVYSNNATGKTQAEFPNN